MDIIDNRYNIDCYDFQDENDEFEVESIDYDIVEKLTHFYECVDNYIFEKDFDSFINCIYVRLGYNNIKLLFEKYIDINDYRMKSFLNLIEPQFKESEYLYSKYPTTLERLSNFILDKIELKFGIVKV